MSDPSFENQLSLLVAKELPHARHNPDRLSGMIERLSVSLGLVIAVGSAGDQATAQKLADGSHHYVDGEVISKLAMGEFLAGLGERAMRKRPK